MHIAPSYSVYINCAYDHTCVVHLVLSFSGCMVYMHIALLYLV